MEIIDLCGGEAGSIWGRKPNPRQKDGFLLSISNTRIGLTAQGKHVPFTKVTFGSHGSWFVASDQLGVVYCIDIGRNRYQVIHRLGQLCTALLVSHTHSNQLYVALANLNVHCINIDSHQLVSTFGPHDASIKSLSLHQSGRYLLVVTACDSVLWDTHTNKRCRTLCGGETVGVQDVFFLPMSNSILTCFKDDSIHAWETDTLEYKYLLPSPSGPVPNYRAFATTIDGRLLVAGGRSNALHIWDMQRHQLEHIIQLPPKIKCVKQLMFVGNTFDGHKSELLGILAQDGIIRFISIIGCKLLFQLGNNKEELISQAHLDSAGHYVVAINDQGSLMIYDIFELLKSHQMPSTPITDILEMDRSPSPHVSKLSTTLSSTKPVKKTSQTSRSSKTKQTSTVGGVTLNLTRLKSILKGYGEYPAKYRSFIWRSLLHLPENHSAYSALLEKGTHPAYVNISTKYPIKSQKLLRVLQRALSALAHWTPLFSEVEYLPALVFPFVKLFQNNQLVTFEIVATILYNWCNHWFEYFPNPPLNVLALVENLLSHHDPHLLQHFVAHKITAQVYAWPLLQTLFSEVLSKDEWLKLWDNILSQPLSFLLMVATGYLSSARQTLLKCTTAEDVEYFVRHQSSVNLSIVLQDAYRMQEATPNEFHPQETLGEFTRLTQGTYPVFNKYPKYIIDYQLQEKERIRKEEQEYLRQRQQSLELERLAEQRKLEEEAWQRQQELLLVAEDQRKKMLELEEQKLADQRARLTAMKREARIKELRSLDDARQRYLEQQQTVREAEITKMDQEIQRKILLRDKETQEAIEEVELRSLELQAQRARMEQELTRRHDLAMYHLREHHQIERDTAESRPLSKEFVDKQRDRLQLAQTKLAQLEVERSCEVDENLTQAHQELRTIQQDLRDQELYERQQECQLEGEKLEKTIRDLRLTEENDTSTTSVLSHDEKGVQWPHQRHVLDAQEAQLLSSVYNLRRRVAQHMRDSNETLSSFTN